MIQSAQRLPYSDSCVQNVLRIRAEIQERKARLPQLKLDLDGLIDAPFNTDPRLEDQRQKGISRLRREIENFQDQIAQLESLLETMERECKESEAQRPDHEDRAALEHSLRQTIDDPRYWRDGDPALARLVSGGFKRLYPDGSED
jgi:chromosome segregation ATPase